LRHQKDERRKEGKRKKEEVGGRNSGGPLGPSHVLLGREARGKRNRKEQLWNWKKMGKGHLAGAQGTLLPAGHGGVPATEKGNCAPTGKEKKDPNYQIGARRVGHPEWGGWGTGKRESWGWVETRSRDPNSDWGKGAKKGGGRLKSITKDTQPGHRPAGRWGIQKKVE